MINATIKILKIIISLNVEKMAPFCVPFKQDDLTELAPGKTREYILKKGGINNGGMRL